MMTAKMQNGKRVGSINQKQHQYEEDNERIMATSTMRNCPFICQSTTTTTPITTTNIKSIDTIQPPQSSKSNERGTATTTRESSIPSSRNGRQKITYQAPLPLWYNSLALLTPTEDSILFDERTCKCSNNTIKKPTVSKSSSNTNNSTTEPKFEGNAAICSNSLELPKTKKSFSVTKNNEVQSTNTEKQQKTSPDQVDKRNQRGKQYNNRIKGGGKQHNSLDQKKLQRFVEKYSFDDDSKLNDKEENKKRRQSINDTNIFSLQKNDVLVGSVDDIGCNNQEEEIQRSKSTSSIQPNRNGLSNNIVQSKGYPLDGTSPQKRSEPMIKKQFLESPSYRSVTSYFESLKLEEQKQTINESTLPTTTTNDAILNDYGIDNEYDYDLQHAAEDDDCVYQQQPNNNKNRHHHKEAHQRQQLRLSAFKWLTPNLREDSSNHAEHDFSHHDEDDHHHQGSFHSISPKKIIKSILPFSSNNKAKVLSNSIKELDDILLSSSTTTTTANNKNPTKRNIVSAAATMMIHTTSKNKNNMLFSKQKNTKETDPELFASLSTVDSIDEFGAIWNDDSINADDGAMINMDQPIYTNFTCSTNNRITNRNEAIISTITSRGNNNDICTRRRSTVATDNQNNNINNRSSIVGSRRRRSCNITDMDHYNHQHDNEDDKCRMFEF